MATVDIKYHAEAPPLLCMAAGKHEFAQVGWGCRSGVFRIATLMQAPFSRILRSRGLLLKKSLEKLIKLSAVDYNWMASILQWVGEKKTRTWPPLVPLFIWTMYILPLRQVEETPCQGRLICRNWLVKLFRIMKISIIIVCSANGCLRYSCRGLLKSWQPCAKQTAGSGYESYLVAVKYYSVIPPA